MKAIVFDEFGSADVLGLAEAPMPEVRPDDLLVKVMAAGLNRADLLQREGVYGSQSYGDSDILGLEVAGEVIAMGNAVTGFAVGDRVMGIVGGGAYAQYARLDSGMATAIPAGIGCCPTCKSRRSHCAGYCIRKQRRKRTRPRRGCRLRLQARRLRG